MDRPAAVAADLAKALRLGQRVRQARASVGVRFGVHEDQAPRGWYFVVRSTGLFRDAHGASLGHGRTNELFGRQGA